MNRRQPLAATTVIGVLMLGSAPVAAQHARLEEAWAVCEGVHRSRPLGAALETAAPAAGFPKQQDGIFAVRDDDRQVLVLLVERDEEDEYPDECVVISNGGDRQQMADRAARFWAPRGYQTYVNGDLPYAASPRDDHSLGVRLAQSSDGFWRMVVSGARW